MSTRREGGRAACEPGREASAFIQQTRGRERSCAAAGVPVTPPSHRALKPSRLTSLGVLLTAPLPRKERLLPRAPSRSPDFTPRLPCLRPGEASPRRVGKKRRADATGRGPAATHTGRAFPHPPKGSEETGSRPPPGAGDSAHTPPPGRCRQGLPRSAAGRGNVARVT